MTAAVKKVYDQLMIKLAPGERIELADMLLVDAGDFAGSEVEEAWKKELDRRIDDYEAGKSKLIPAKEVHAQIRRRLNEIKARRVSSRRAA